MSVPRVSAVIAARDAADTLHVAVGSLLAQAGVDLEVIVVDDGSRDATQQILKEVEDPRLRVLTLPGSVGRAEARNLAIEMSQAEFIAIQDADDSSFPWRLSETVALMDAHAERVVVSGQPVYVDPRFGPWRLRVFPTRDEEIRTALRAGDMAVCHTACLIRRESLISIGGYRSKYTRAQDFDLMFRLAAQGEFAATERILVKYAHPVRLPFGYWQESRRCANAVLGDDVPVESLPLADRVRYGPAMARRVARYVATRHEPTLQIGR